MRFNKSITSLTAAQNQICLEYKFWLESFSWPDKDDTRMNPLRHILFSNAITFLRFSLSRPLRLYTLPYWSNPPFLIFTMRAYARAVLGVVILSVRLSVTCVDYDKCKWCVAYILVAHERAITLLLWYQQWFVGNVPFPLLSVLKVTHPSSRNADFNRFPLIMSQT